MRHLKQFLLTAAFQKFDTRRYQLQHKYMPCLLSVLIEFIKLK